MSIDTTAVTSFMATHARLLDRRRFELVCGRAEPDEVLAALEGYRNPDGGYGWALEPDLRSPESQLERSSTETCSSPARRSSLPIVASARRSVRIEAVSGVFLISPCLPK